MVKTVHPNQLEAAQFLTPLRSMLLTMKLDRFELCVLTREVDLEVCAYDVIINFA